MKILAIESSCDETAAAIVEDGRTVLSNIIASQVDAHVIYGGVVPEIASRMHSEAISGVVSQALEKAMCTLNDIDAIAVTYAPGLIGALLVGVNFAKGLSLSSGLPLIPVHHLRSHVASNYLTHPSLTPEFISLIVSGGHSHLVKVSDYTKYEIIGRTRDDAAGECMDKAARSLGLPYPGGLNLDRVSAGGNTQAFSFPKPKVEGSKFDFSFSGLKTAAVNIIHNAEQKGTDIVAADFGASFIDAVTEVLCEHTISAAKEYDIKKIALAGGVSANAVLRKKMSERCAENGLVLFYPDIELCGDNAAMVGSQGYYEYLVGNLAGNDLNAYATMEIDQAGYHAS